MVDDLILDSGLELITLVMSMGFVHAAVGGGVPCLVMVPSVPSVSVCCWFRHLVFPALRVPADIVGVWSMAALVLVFCACWRISSGGCNLSGCACACLLSAGWILCLGVFCAMRLWCGRISF